MTESALEQQLHSAFNQAILDCRKFGYNPTRFAQLLAESGALRAAQSLIDAPQTSDGFARLWEHGRLDLSVEGIILQQRFSALFTEVDLDRARQRLRDHGYETSVG